MILLKRIAYHKRDFAIGAVMILLVGCGENKQAAQAPPQAIPVAFEQLSNSTLIDSSDFVGTLEAVTKVALASQIDGRIGSIYATSGQNVAVGEKILRLVPLKQQAQVNQAKAQVGQAKADLVQSEVQLQSAQAQKSKTIDALAQRRADIAQSAAQLEGKQADLIKAKSDLVLAQKNYQRSQFLIKEGAISQQDLDNKTAALENTKSSVDSALKNKDAAQASLQASKEALNSAYSDQKIADKQIQAAQANIENKKQAIDASISNVGAVNQDLKYNTVLSPITGTVGDLSSKKIGDILTSGTAFTTIVDNSKLNLNIYVPVEKRNQLKIGLPVEIIKANESPGNVGKITFISPTVNQDSQVILVKVTFNNNGDLKDSQYVKTRIIWNKTTGILIPTSVVSNIGASDFVFVVEKGKNSDGKETQIAKQRLVKLGKIQGQQYQVLSGLKPGEQIITSRTQILANGMPVISEALLQKSLKKGS